MNNSAISIPLSKTGKYAGMYTAIVDECDSDLALLNWTVRKKPHTEYALRGTSQNKKILLHRAIMERILKRELEVDEQVDHINGCGLDNRRCNLRLATYAQNSMNKGMRKDNSSGYKGVFWNKKIKKFTASIKVNRKSQYLGAYDTEIEAHAAYCEAAKLYFGEFARYE